MDSEEQSQTEVETESKQSPELKSSESEKISETKSDENSADESKDDPPSTDKPEVTHEETEHVTENGLEIETDEKEKSEPETKTVNETEPKTVDETETKTQSDTETKTECENEPEPEEPETETKDTPAKTSEESTTAETPVAEASAEPKEPSPDCAIIEAGLKKILFSPPCDDGSDSERKDGKIRIAKNKNRVAEKKKKPGENGDSQAKRSKTEEGRRTTSNYQKLAPLDRTGPAEERVLSMMKEDVHPLKKRNNKFPMAAYVCRLCSYHCDNMEVCERHVRDAKHKQLKENRELDLLLKNLPALTPVHIQALDTIIEKTCEQYALPKGVVGHRQTLVKKLEATIQEDLEDVTLELYGSSVNGFGLKTSDINIDIILPPGRSASETLKQVFKLLCEKSNYVNVMSDFQAKIPSISFTDPISDVSVRLSLGNHLARYTTQLLAAYCKVDPRVQKLGVALRYFAKICDIDQQVMGTLPAHAFALMTVYFLQRTSPPVLPVLHEMHGEGRSRESVEYEGKDLGWFFDDIDKLGDQWECRNTASCGELWVQLFRYYCTQFDLNRHVVCVRQKKTVNRDDKKWSHKKLAIEDPFSTRLNLSRSVSHNKNLDYIHDCLKLACKYYGIPQTKSGPLFRRVPLKQKKAADARAETLVMPRAKVIHDTPADTLKDNRSYKEIAHGVVDIAVESMRKDLEDCGIGQSSEVTDVKTDHLDNVESIQINPIPESKRRESVSLDKKVQSVVLASFSGAYLDILDTKASEVLHASLKHDDVHNVVSPDEEAPPAESGDHATTKDDVTKDGDDVIDKPDADDSIDHGKASLDDPDVSLADSELNDSAIDVNLDDSGIGTPVPKAKILGRDSSEEAEEDITEIMDASVEDSAAVEAPETQDDVEKGVEAEENRFVVDESSKAEGDYNRCLLEGLKIKDLMFTFDRVKLTEGKKPSIVCSVCQQEGHLKNDCPESVLPEVKPLKPLTDDFKVLLEKVLGAVVEEYSPTETETEERKEILEELESFIREVDEFKNCNLCMFGSSCNQFGFKKSDLDICMTLEGVDSPKDINCIDIIEKVAQKLKVHKGLYNVSAITTAKVPIVKFRHRKAQIEADISLYNTLALHNTRLLEVYALMDPRVRTLGYVMKVFAKVCDIGDASRGSLSSYAYILMVLYYLQRCDPPLIPCLQEMYEGERPTTMIDGCDAWFFDDLEAIPEKWPGHGQNTQSVSELWLGMLCYYVEKFDFKEHVISIKQIKPLTRFEKLWNGKTIAIEDPFDLHHNLGAGLSRKMNTFIMKAFINARHRFGTSLTDTENPPQRYETFHKYLFDAAALVEGLPPTDRGCRVCGKIGHIARECPIVLNRKEREMRDRRMQADRMGPPMRGPPMRGDQRRDMRGQPMMDRRRGPPHMQGPPPFRQGMPPYRPHVYYNSGMGPRGPHMGPRGPYPGPFPPGHPGARMHRPPPPHMYGGQGPRGMVLDPRHAHLRSDARFPPPGHFPPPGPPRPARPPGYPPNHRPPPPPPANHRPGPPPNQRPAPHRSAPQPANHRPRRDDVTGDDVSADEQPEEEAEEEEDTSEARRHELDAQEKLERGIRAPNAGKTAVVLGKQDSRLDPNYEELRKKVVEDRAQQLKLHQQHLEELAKQKPADQGDNYQPAGQHHTNSYYPQQSQNSNTWRPDQHQPDQYHQQQRYQNFSQRPNYQQREVYSPNKPHQNTNYNNAARDASKDFKMDAAKIGQKDGKQPTSQTFSQSNHFSADSVGKDASQAAPVTPQWKKTHGPMLLQRPPGVTSGQLPLPVDLGLDKPEDKPDTQTQENQPIPPFQIGLAAAANQRMMFNKDSLVNQMLPMQPPFRSPNRPPSPTSTSPLALLNQSISPSKRYNQAADPYRKRRSPSKDQPPRFQQGKPAVRQLDQAFGQDHDQNQAIFQPAMVNPQIQNMVPGVHHTMQPTYLFYPQQAAPNYQPRPEQKDDLFSRESMFPQHVMSQALNTFQGHPIFPQQSQQYGQDQPAREEHVEHKFEGYQQYPQDTSQQFAGHAGHAAGQGRDMYTQQHHVYYQNQNQLAQTQNIQTPQDATSNFYQTTPQSQSAALTGTQIWFTSMAQPGLHPQQETSSQQSIGSFNYRTQPSPSSALDRSQVPRNDPWMGGSGSVSSYPTPPAPASDWLQQTGQSSVPRLDHQLSGSYSLGAADHFSLDGARPS